MLGFTASFACFPQQAQEGSKGLGTVSLKQEWSQAFLSLSS